MYDTDEAAAMLEAMRRLHRRRHADMSRLIALGHLSGDAGTLESLQLSAILRMTENAIKGVEKEMPSQYHFDMPELAACFARQLARLRAEGAPEVESLEQLQGLIGLGVEVLRLPEPQDDGSDVNLTP